MLRAPPGRSMAVEIVNFGGCLFVHPRWGGAVGPICRPGERRAAQSHQACPKEAQEEPSAGTAKGPRLTMSRHHRPIS